LTYHAELPNYALYSSGSPHPPITVCTGPTSARSFASIRPTCPVSTFEIGDGPLVLSPDGKYFYLYFPDWIANGTLHHEHRWRLHHHSRLPRTAQLVTSDARRCVQLNAPSYHSLRKVLPGQLDPAARYRRRLHRPQSEAPRPKVEGYLDVHYDSALQRYVMIMDNDTTFYYAESVDALHWTLPASLGTFGPIAAYPTAVGLGDDPHILGASYYVYFTHLPADGAGWTDGSLRRLTFTCP
jgi:hypothetical protein